jgi:hypothetical protein
VLYSTYTTWTIEILPYMEQQNLYQQYRQNEVNSQPTTTLSASRHQDAQCPSDSMKGKLKCRSATAKWSVMHGSYRAVSGS